MGPPAPVAVDDTLRIAAQLRLAAAIEAELVAAAPPSNAAAARLGRDEGSSISVSALWRNLLLPHATSAKGGGSSSSGGGGGGGGASRDTVHAWYSAGAAYWEVSHEHTTVDCSSANWPTPPTTYRHPLQRDDVPATVSGVLGGQEHVADDDVRESLAFLDALTSSGGGGGGDGAVTPPMQRGRALDCGAGIGRVTRDVLVHRFRTVDVLEQSPKMAAQAACELAAWTADEGGGGGRVGAIVCCGLQDLVTPATAASVTAAAAVSRVGDDYDCVWLQWVIGCVMDVDFVDLLRALATRLAPTGVIVLKDNIVSQPEGTAFQYDRGDHSITRSRAYLDALIARAGLHVATEVPQVAWDDELLPVVMLALRPDPAAAAAAAAAAMSPAERFRANLAAHRASRGAAVTGDA